MEHNGLFFYRGVTRHDIMQDMVMLEQDIASHIAFNKKPQDRLFNAQIDRMEHFVLRYRSWQHQQIQYRSECRGLRGIRAGLILINCTLPKRWDNVWRHACCWRMKWDLVKPLGGTGLRQQLFAEKVQRVLILVPESLQHRGWWKYLRRFNLPFLI